MTRYFDAGFSRQGFTLFEHWENDGRDLLLVTSNFTAIGELKPGDHIVKRTWSAAGVPVITNCAHGPLTFCGCDDVAKSL